MKDNVLSEEETKEFAKETANNIWSKVKELGYSTQCNGDDDEDGIEEEDEEEVVEQETSDKQPMEEEEEEVIHMYSDEEDILEQSQFILDINYE